MILGYMAFVWFDRWIVGEFGAEGVPMMMPPFAFLAALIATVSGWLSFIAAVDTKHRSTTSMWIRIDAIAFGCSNMATVLVTMIYGTLGPGLPAPAYCLIAFLSVVPSIARIMLTGDLRPRNSERPRK